MRQWLLPGVLPVTSFIYYDLPKLPESLQFRNFSDPIGISKFGRRRPAPETARKQSRFFPSLKVKETAAPQTGCRLHRDDELGATGPAHNPANLWKILRDDEIAAPPGSQLEPAELDGGEVPFAHPNALTGLSNEISSTTLPEHTIVPMSRSSIGMNEFLVDHDVVVPDTEPCSGSNSCAGRDAAFEDVPPVEHESYEDEDTDKHFRSEQNLFGLPSPPSTALWKRSVDTETSHCSECGSDCRCKVEGIADSSPYDEEEVTDDWGWYDLVDEQPDVDDEAFPITWKEFLDESRPNAWTREQSPEYDEELVSEPDWVLDL